MKIFISYKFSNQDIHELKSNLNIVSKALRKNGHEDFIFFRDIQNYITGELSSKEIINRALNELHSCDAILALVTTPEKSEGLLLEVGYAKAQGKTIILAIKKDTRAIFLRDLADKIIEFEDIKELENLHITKPA
jgi:nucleoside 2-deoxyribosyltransferase